LTTSLARAVAPVGHVHTFEFHELRTTLARADFEQNGKRHCCKPRVHVAQDYMLIAGVANAIAGLGDLITVVHRDIEALGFPAEFHSKADAIFLDLPGPWKVGVFCSISFKQYVHAHSVLSTFCRHCPAQLRASVKMVCSAASAHA
jgi:tRNA A58 N-methylase Trm61